MTNRSMMIFVMFISMCSRFLVGQEASGEQDRRVASESYFRAGLKQAQQKRTVYEPVCEAAKKEFIQAQSKAVKIIRPPVTKDGKPVFVFGESPVATITENGREVAMFYRRDDRDHWVSNLYGIFQQRAKRLNDLPLWELPILDLRTAKVGDCGHLIRR